ncbi:uncharacterized protein BT62DRAFT_919004 [Guyanagaster necrorhizus]|uniref:Uncharacterized protein n=1 Tax=Guyanagaster necrorhizus TaxID=856835 RepID=A0A9P7VUM9_9AGAR|nr:uncharacterized protein BT62DRAFT_919004 [Guyanagaster necrorhizus MCA 3950]KAG7447796.1 hypothetical protein BT62DRAFT_919004 [Guyanagaster necrorhizus MCA 3950]
MPDDELSEIDGIKPNIVMTDGEEKRGEVTDKMHHDYMGHSSMNLSSSHSRTGETYDQPMFPQQHSLPFHDPYFGTVLAIVCSPADILKDQDQMSTLGVIKASLKNEGPVFMFKGWLPAWTCLQLTTVLIFLTLEQLKDGVNFSRGKGYTFL